MDPSMVKKSGKKVGHIPRSHRLQRLSPCKLHGRLDSNPRHPFRDRHTNPKPVSGRCPPSCRPQDHQLRTRAPRLDDLVDLGAIQLIDNDHHHLRVGSQGTASVGLQAIILFTTSIFGFGFMAQKAFSWTADRHRKGNWSRRLTVFIAASIIVSAIVSENLGILYHYGLVRARRAAARTILWVTLFGSSVVKFTGHFLPALICKIPFKDALALSLILSAQGIVELSGCLTFRENDAMQTLDDQTFSAVTSSVCRTALVVLLLVRSIYDYYHRYGGCLNLPVRLLACAQRPEDAMATIRLLESSYASKDNPFSIFALHLLELVGRASPMLINHQLG
ncbi:hypothetical protein Acr_03g0002400 [Actinidia rufa]|uniref:Uncharacterized protein n=1 Tax=Actinidia rufa TaxID=165716 RepID=A0A7J0EBB6_9ERIC|nr:hypothetical protein Acr_03g0002400 [Actinidia rufa]